MNNTIKFTRSNKATTQLYQAFNILDHHEKFIHISIYMLLFHKMYTIDLIDLLLCIDIDHQQQEKDHDKPLQKNEKQEAVPNNDKPLDIPLSSWYYHSFLLDLTRFYIQTNDKPKIVQLIELYQANNFVDGLLIIYKHSIEYIYQAIELIIQQDDLNQLNELVDKFMSHKTSVAYWRYLLKQLVNSAKSTTFQYVIRLMMNRLGTSLTLKLVVEYQDVLASCYSQFFMELLTFDQLRSKQVEYKQKLLSNLNMHLWRHNHPHLSSTAYHVYKDLVDVVAEDSVKQKSCFLETSSSQVDQKSSSSSQVDQKSSQVDQKASSAANSHDTKRLDENQAKHWGKYIDFNNLFCYNCNLSIELPQQVIKQEYTYSSADFIVVDNTQYNPNTSLILFPCGHVYHQICVPQRTCNQCFDQSFLKQQ